MDQLKRILQDLDKTEYQREKIYEGLVISNGNDKTTFNENRPKTMRSKRDTAKADAELIHAPGLCSDSPFSKWSVYGDKYTAHLAL